MSSHPLPVCVLLDLEPDEFFPEPGQAVACEGIRHALAVMRELRPHLAAATGHPVSFGWRLRTDAAIELLCGRAEGLLDPFRDALAACAEAGDDLGTHVHLSRWVGDPGRWVLDFADPAWVRHSIDVAAGGFQRLTGEAVRSFSFGDCWADHESLAYVGGLGVRVDTTLELGLDPGRDVHQGHRRRGDLPDLRGVPAAVYRASSRDFRCPAEAGDPGLGELWMVPIHRAPAGRVEYLRARFDEWRGNREMRTGHTPGGEAGPAPQGSWGERIRRNLFDIFLAGHRGAARLAPTLPPASFEARLGGALVAGPGHLAMVLRSDELRAPRRVAHLRRNLLALARRSPAGGPSAGGVRFQDPVSLVEDRAAALKPAEE